MNSAQPKPFPDGEQEQVEEEPVVGVIDGSLALTAIDRAQVDVQITTAKANPRSITKALREARDLATMDSETAASMFYTLPRSGKTIEGPSVRLAEVMVYTWGNIRAEADIVAEDRTHITAMGTCFDLEKNVAVRVRVKRRITKKNGQRFNDDMITVASNAAMAIALRNAVFKVIPAVMIKGVYVAARRASIEGEGTLSDKRTAAIGMFEGIGIPPAKVFELVGVVGADDIGEEQLIKLRGIMTAIRDGDISVVQILAGDREETPGTGALNDKLDELKKESAEEFGRIKAELALMNTPPAMKKWKSKNVKRVAALLPEHQQAVADLVFAVIPEPEVG